jgi:hypothetical protein
MKMYGKVDMLFISALDCCECSDPNRGHFTSWETATGKYWIRRWVNYRAGGKAVKKRKISVPIGN